MIMLIWAIQSQVIDIQIRVSYLEKGIFGTATTFIMFPLGMAISIHFCHIEKINFPVVDGRVSVANVLDHL